MAPPDAVNLESGPDRASEFGHRSDTLPNTNVTPSQSRLALPTTPPTRVLMMALPTPAQEKSVKTADHASTTGANSAVTAPHRFEKNALIGSQYL